MELSKLVKLLSTHIAERFVQYPQKWNLELGSDADFLVVDLEKEVKIHSKDLYYKNKWSPYDNITGKGDLHQTCLRGKCVYDKDKGFLQGETYGRLMRRKQ